MDCINTNAEQKINTDNLATLCRCCLKVVECSNYGTLYESLFYDLTGLNMSQLVGLPAWICAECTYLLIKCVKFKHKIVKAHNILYEYSTRCAPDELAIKAGARTSYKNNRFKSVKEVIVHKVHRQACHLSCFIWTTGKKRKTYLPLGTLEPLIRFREPKGTREGVCVIFQFPVDAQDTELKQYATPQLCATEVLLVDNNGKMQGFHPAEEHKKVFTYTDLTTGLDLNEVKIENVPQVVKAEGNCSDLDDNIPLEEFRSKCEEDFDVTDCDIMDNDFDIVAAVSERKMKKMSSVKKKKSSKSSQSSRKSSVRKQLDIDPKKITTLILNHEEQLKFRDQQSKDPKYLKSPFKCKMCYKGFNHENKLDNHMSKHSPNRGKFECKLCHVYLPTIYSYNIHELTHTTRYVCNECGRKMVDRYSIVEHYSTTHEGVVKEYPCLVCGKISHNLKTHYGHMRNHHSGDRPKCDQCGKSFINRDSLNDHMLIHQGIKNHECEICLKRFRTNTQLKHHQLKHSDSRNYYCVECDVRFKSEFNMRRHLLDSVKHRDKSQLKYECPRCDARLVSAGALSHHLTFQHDGLRLFSCTVCGASLATRNSLTKHMRYAHQGHKPPLKHICDTCGKAFRSKNVLVNHVRTHTGEKPFECPECGRKFSQRTAMKTHVKLVHLKIKRNEKVKEIQPIQPTIVAKEELTLTFDEDWQRRALQQGDIYFTVTSE